MLFHLVPKVFNPFSDIEDIKLLSVTIPDYGIELKEDELSQGRPFPNKNYVVGMLKNSRKAMNGMLITLPHNNIKKFAVKMIWQMEVGGKQVQLSHTVFHEISGTVTRNCDLVSYDAVLWYAQNKFDMKWPERHIHQSPMEIQPVLNLEQKGMVDQMSEIELPVLERDRLYTNMSDRVPEKIWVKPSLYQ